MKIVSNGPVPFYATEGAAAFDLHAMIDEAIELEIGEIKPIPTGLRIAVPEGFAGLVLPRSGAASRGLTVANSPGCVDRDYRGEVKVLAHNVSGRKLTIHPTDRIAQMMITPYVKVEFEVVEELDATDRGEGGFGSTGK
jgi:dUTP pyrophosphatase